MRSNADSRHIRSFSLGLLLLAITLFTALACFEISLPGIQYDEALFVQPALGADETIFVDRQWAGIPIMLMDYIGALKSWIYAPIFATLGFSPLIMRLPMILLSGLTLLVLFRMLRREAGPLPACLLVLLMAVDPVFVFHSRLDWGPFAIRMFIKALVLDQWFLTVRSPSLRRMGLIALLIAIGIWDKLNFLWFAFAFGVAALAVYPATLISAWKAASRAWRILAAVFAAAGLAAILLILSGQDYGGNSQLNPGQFKKLVHNTAHALSGNSLTTFLTNHPLYYPDLSKRCKEEQVLDGDPLLVGETHLYLMGGIAVLLLATTPLVYSGSFKQSSPCRQALFFTALFAATFASILLTPGDAGGLHKSHHIMALYPYHLIILLLLSGNRLRPRFKWSRGLTVSIVLCCSLIYGLVFASGTVEILRYLRADRQLDPRWSPRIYELADYINREGGDADWIISIDWGIHNQVHALCDDSVRRKMSDLWLELKLAQRDPDRDSVIREALLAKRKTLVLLYDRHNAVQQGSVNQFFRMARHNGLEIETVHEIRKDGETVFQVLEARGREAERRKSVPNPNSSSKAMMKPQAPSRNLPPSAVNTQSAQ